MQGGREEKKITEFPRHYGGLGDISLQRWQLVCVMDCQIEAISLNKTKAEREDAFKGGGGMLD